MSSIDRDKFARHCGIEILETSEGYAKARMKISNEHLNGLDMTHGGALFSLADTTFAAAANTHDFDAVAVNANVSFLKPTTAGDEVIAEAREVNPRGRLGCVKVDVTDSTGDPVAVFEGLAYRKF
ncbi:PaaI family thioesterase [Sedimentisphaera salicampi]|uniref:PaaI family thioesterase n=1 Tax=Sedimentisphaera salicampi TaxID=1941349 RepID=UPI000B9B5C1A|nr:PaaI family thioesterase [Sedimentisphaera salicampi]OXU14696.1 Acyl-coenzyme A thioesterase PaaI [Sedimentisphaera salicampi]